MENASRDNAPTPSGAWDTSRLKAGHEVWRLTPTEQDRTRLWSAAGGSGRELDPVWEALRSRIRTGLDAFGFALVRQLFPAGPVADVHQEADVTERVSRLVRDFGEIVPQNSAGDLTQVLRRREGDPDEIAFHCDTCDLLVLLCLRPAARGGATRVAGAPYLHDVLAAERPDVLELLGQKWYFDRAGRAGSQLVHTPILTTGPDSTVTCYYQSRTVRASAGRDGRPPLDAARAEALDVLDEVLNRPETAYPVTLNSGDLLIIRNSRVMHGRSPFTDAPEPHHRRVLRLWLDEVAP
ncbi:TauD/TfdA family dioxygenase [Streptomyces sp. SR-10]|uniref:TauD/TfdA family dioxygenase n=1 Tax=Streptomyces sp. SR-10 TaxID=3416442 RepID=UPI003CF48DB1